MIRDETLIDHAKALHKSPEPVQEEKKQADRASWSEKIPSKGRLPLPPPSKLQLSAGRRGSDLTKKPIPSKLVPAPPSQRKASGPEPKSVVPVKKPPHSSSTLPKYVVRAKPAK